MNIGKLKSKKYSLDELSSVVEALLKHILACGPVEKLYLIGSLVRDSFTEYSDIDFVIVLPENGNVESFKSKLYSKRPYQDIAVDFNCMLASQFHEMKDKGGLAFEAKHHGKLLYPRKASDT